MCAENRAGADKANARDDLCCNAGMVAAGISGLQLIRQNGEHGSPKTNKHIGAHSSGAMLHLSLQPNQSAQNASQHQSHHGQKHRRRRFCLQQIVKMVQCRHQEFLDFITVNSEPSHLEQC